jgi:hypothetical protein
MKIPFGLPRLPIQSRLSVNSSIVFLLSSVGQREFAPFRLQLQEAGR